VTLVDANATLGDVPATSVPVSSLRACLRGTRSAFAVLTRIPVGGFPYSDLEQRWAGAHFPLVGAVVGAVSALVWGACLRAGYAVAAVVAVVASIAVTGALHEDGLADTVDALGGGTSRERVFAILKDPAVGAFGVCAIVLSLVLRCALLARLASRAPVALVFVGGASRFGALALIVALPYVTPAALAKNRSVAAASTVQLGVAAAWVLLLGIGARALGHLSLAELGAPAVLGALVVALSGSYFRARVGGITGDFLGATQQLCECAMLLAMAIGGER
jgi:adenosylcobinamide-GDP ribazoletransferase